MALYITGCCNLHLSSCSVSDSLDDVLQITKQSGTKRKPQKQNPDTGVKSKPVKGVFDVEDDNNASSLGTDDILQYIKQETNKDGDDDLF